jgi:flavin-binding protein dodecin
MLRTKTVVTTFAAALAAGMLAACATPTPFAAADSRGYGYREQRIETDRYIVTFSGNSATNGDQVADMALRRAAELTLAEGYDWFEVVSRTDNVDGGGRSGSGVSVGVGGVSGGGRSSVGTSVGLSFPLGGGGGGAASSTSLEVRMGGGERPDRVTAYDALSVARNLAGAVTGP